MKVLKKTTLIVTIIVLIYWAGYFILMITPASYRLWVKGIGVFLTWCVAPMLYILLVGSKIFSRIKDKKVIKIFIGIIVLGFHLCWCILVILFTKSILQYEAEFSRYYHPVAFFFKMPTVVEERTQVECPEEKYDSMVSVSCFIEDIIQRTV